MRETPDAGLEGAPRPGATEPIADPRPARTNRVLAALLVVALLLFVLTRLMGLDDLGYVLAGGTLTAVLFAMLASPAIWLGALSAVRPTRIGRELRWTGRASALVLGFEGAWLLRESLDSAATWQLVLGMVLVPFCAWVLARSWRLPREAREEKRSLSLYRLLFALSALCVVGVTLLIRPFAHSFDKSYVTAMKSDLRNLHEEQRAFRDSVGRFAGFRELRVGQRASPGVHLAMTADSVSWRAVAVHDQVRDECTLWGGGRPREARFAAAEGEPYCRPP